MTDTVVINYATGGPDSIFGKGQRRLVAECRRQGYQGDFLIYNDDNPLNCPPHSHVPYGFKPYAMKEAQRLGYRYLLWCDCSVYPVAPLERAFEIIRETGYMFLPGGWNTGQWCSDAALDTLGITREEAFEIPHMVAGCQGIDIGTEELHEVASQLGPYRDIKTKGRQYLDRYYELAGDGITFQGAWTNRNHEVSKDDRVLGHRHDQTAASVIAWQLGMRDWKPNVVMYDESGVAPRKETIIFLVKSA